MKNMFSQLVQSCIANGQNLVLYLSKRLLLLLAAVSLFPIAASADHNYVNCRVYVATNSTGKGKVWLTKSYSSKPDGWFPNESRDYDESTNDGLSATFYFYLYANPEPGYYHVGWSKKSDGSDTEPDSQTNSNQEYYLATVVSPYTNSDQADNNPFKFYAVFKDQTVYKNSAPTGIILLNDEGVEIIDANSDCTVSVSESVDNQVKFLNSNPTGSWSYTYNATAGSNYTFVGWRYNGVDVSSALPYTRSFDTKVLYTAYQNGTAPAQAGTMYAVFRKSTKYYAKQEPEANIVVIDQNNQPVTTDLDLIGELPEFTLSTSAPDGIIIGERGEYDADVFWQRADDCGTKPQASFIWSFTPNEFECDDYMGVTNGTNYGSITDEAESYVAVATSTNPNEPSTYTLKLVYKRQKINLFSYNKEDDAFLTEKMKCTETAGIKEYLESSTEDVSDRLYRIVTGMSGEITADANANGDFTAGVETISGYQVLRVKPKSNEGGSGVITVKVGGVHVATLEIRLNPIPVYVTLKPAEDLKGTYTYTQNTTGAQEFHVTTSEVKLQMTTSTDYFFTFNPQANDPVQYQFEKWIVRDANGNVIAEPTTANLSYRFNAGESITPVFTAVDRAVFIVKSEPNVQYLDLQEALDRAAALQTTTDEAQTVVVTVSGNRKGGRLVHGDYVIRNGVTLLIPGEETYTEMIGNRDQSSYASSGTIGTFCTLTVEDGTNITVENGNISIYAKLPLLSTTYLGAPSYNHGHLLLGKNCNITVKADGGLYAFGFITGDPSSHIVMESGSEVYEPFCLTDWRGGSHIIGNWAPNVPIIGGRAGVDARVFPVGQYYVQTVEVPLTFQSGATEMLSCCVVASALGQTLEAPVNITFISTYDDDDGLFGLGTGTTLTKSYDPTTDRLKFELSGKSASTSKVKIGCMKLSMKVLVTINVNSKDYVMPIQNNMDIDVKNTTIDLKYDVEFLPGSTMRVHDDATINVASTSNVYIYDRGARKLDDGTSYWYGATDANPLRPLSNTKGRPGGILYGHKAANGKFTAGRTDADLVDAQLIINGDMNVNGGLYTVKGAHAEISAADPDAVGGANITSEGSGKINLKNIGAATVAKQWKQTGDVGVQELKLTNPKLLLHNDLSAGALSAYTRAEKVGASYTYYQTDGTWREPEPGITGVKLYDNQNNAMDTIYVTLPNANVSGYLLATLEPTPNVDYQLSNFTIPATVGNIAIDNSKAIILPNGKLKIPFVYQTQNKHGIYTESLTITYTKDADYIRNLTMPLVVKEDYTPIFTAATTLNIYGRISQDNPANLPIQPAEENITTLSESNDKMVWTYEITGINKGDFAFVFGEGEGNKLSGAKVIFTPASEGRKTATLTLTAKYTDNSDPKKVLTKEHKVSLVGNGIINANTLTFREVGTIKTTTQPFEMLENIQSPAPITVTLEKLGGDEPTNIVGITRVDNTLPNSNYLFTPKTVGQVKVKVVQTDTEAYEEAKIEKTFVVVADPPTLTDVSCVLTEDDFKALTSELEAVEYDEVGNQIQIQFKNTKGRSAWTAHFNSMPGTLTFTPHGDGYWAIQESKDGVHWSEIIWWTQLPNEEQIIALHPTSRKVQIAYSPAKESDPIGYITDLCINPFTIYANTNKVYVPVVEGAVKETKVVFTHSMPTVNITIQPLDVSGLDMTGLDIEQPQIITKTSDNEGGVLNVFYHTTVTLKGGKNIPEWNNAFALVAKQTKDGDDFSADVTLSTYNFPKPLPIQSKNWKSDGSLNNINGYDESERYYHYMISSESEYVKWDASRSNLVFMNKGSNESANRQVVFGYYGLPNRVLFESASTDWEIEESVDGQDWSSVDTETRVITTKGGVNYIMQPIQYTANYVRISYSGSIQTEVSLANLVIEGLPSAVPDNTELEITKSSDQTTPSKELNIHVMNLPQMKLHLDNTDEFEVYHGSGSEWTKMTNTTILDNNAYDCLAVNEQGNITIQVRWKGENNTINEGHISIINPENDSVMAIVRIVGTKDGITAKDPNTGIWTGVPDGKSAGRPTLEEYTLVGTKGDNKVFEPYPYHEVNIKNAFDANGYALFNYLIIYGETTTKDGTFEITRPNTNVGSNAKTPYYLYQRSDDLKSYKFKQAVVNANSPTKANLSEITHFTEFVVDNISYYAIQPKGGQPLSIYITGFCPYATTGSTKDDEGVWYFRGNVNDQVHIYLEDCHLYSRTKSVSGHITSKAKGATDSPFFNAAMVQGSGAVLVFENAAPDPDNPNAAFNVAIHTKGHNLLKSNYGCYYNFILDAKATQISSPVQIRLGDGSHFESAKTILDFDDLWPISDGFADHTNGFLSLQKLSNNAPSIDLGNANTVVNFRGGQIQLENAQIVSPNYKTTLAISYRSGLMTNMEIPMAYGIGTDEVGGTVNFYDGTTTVVPMTVKEEYRGFYLMDQVQAKNEDGTPKVDAEGKPVMVDGSTTTCLRTPTNTFIYGGSHCMMRACSHVTSKGGAPRDATGELLGRYVYNNTNANQGYTYRCVVNQLPEDVTEYQDGYELIYNDQRYVMKNGEWALVGPASFTDPCYIVTPTKFPGDLQFGDDQSLAKYYEDNYPDKEYGLNSVTPDGNGDLSFWVPGGVVTGVSPEEDKQLSAWKACMTEIEAGAFGITRSIGGPTSVEFNEEITNLLYCQLDNNIHSVISDRSEDGVDENDETKYKYHYKAPVVDPTGQLPPEKRYMSISPLHVSDSVQHSIVSEEDYVVTNKIYYVTTAMADTWMNFTMPFDVEKIWVVEPYWEKKIEEYFANPTDINDGETPLQATLRFQARHNADFAAFFGVAMAIGDNSKDFDQIFADYKNWAMYCADRTYVDDAGNQLGTGYYDGNGKYTLRDRYALTHYDGSNFTTANYYLYQNVGEWIIQDAINSQFTTKWNVVPKVAPGKAIMKKGETYSLLFPYCLGCDVEIDENGEIVLGDNGLPAFKERDYWDYWSGKFLIFESTKASQNEPHVIRGSNFVEGEKVDDHDWIFDNHPTDPNMAVLSGNSTFAMLRLADYSKRANVYTYSPGRSEENFYPILPNNDDTYNYPDITPTTTFLLNGNPTKAKIITRTGKVIYDKSDDDNNGNQNDTSGGGHMPTVGGGKDMFITAIEGGINIAVAEPQMVKVMSSTGAVLFAGYVTTATDVQLPTHGIYIVSGENEVQKIMH